MLLDICSSSHLPLRTGFTIQSLAIVDSVCLFFFLQWVLLSCKSVPLLNMWRCDYHCVLGDLLMIASSPNETAVHLHLSGSSLFGTITYSTTTRYSMMSASVTTGSLHYTVNYAVLFTFSRGWHRSVRISGSKTTLLYCFQGFV